MEEDTVSETYNLVCDDCREEIWIGQRGLAQRDIVIYSTALGGALSRFVMVHLRHKLRILPEQETGDLRYTEFKSA